MTTPAHGAHRQHSAATITASRAQRRSNSPTGRRPMPGSPAVRVTIQSTVRPSWSVWAAGFGGGLTIYLLAQTQAWTSLALLTPAFGASCVTPPRRRLKTFGSSGLVE